MMLTRRLRGRKGTPQRGFGAAFAKARKALGMNQEQAGAYFNRSRSTIARWEAGQQLPDPKDKAFMARLDVFQQMAYSMEF